ncbi:general substrate transporter [Fusarium coicis]|nr:general substrate transporter [Fusarium coicis]
MAPKFLEGTTPSGFGCMLIASIGALLYGFDNGWWGTILGTHAFLRDYGSCEIVDGKDTCHLTAPQVSAGSAVQSVGIMLGCILAAWVNETIGRRLSLVTTGLISIVGIVIELSSAIGSPRYSQFVVGKTVAALAMGMAVNIVPIYLSETSTAAARGFAVNMYQNVMLVGAITASGVVYGTSQLQSSACYLIPIGLQLFAPVMLIILAPMLPESPRWLITKGRNEAAAIAARRLFATDTNSFNSDDYVEKIHLAVEEDRSQSSAGWKEMLRGPDLRRLLIGVGIQCLAQAQGVTYILNYISFFLGYAGITNIFPYVISAFCLNYAGVLTGHYLPDRFGRRVLVIWTSAICGVSLIIMSALMISKGNDASGIVMVVLLFIWMASLGAQSPLVWIITAESAPTRNREKVIATSIFFGFGTALLTSSVSPFIQDPEYGNLGGKIGFLWASFSFATIAWVFFLLPEMKGFSLEQLDYLFNNNTPTRKFKKYIFSDSVAVQNKGLDDEKDAEMEKGPKEETVEQRA